MKEAKSGGEKPEALQMFVGEVWVWSERSGWTSSENNRTCLVILYVYGVITCSTITNLNHSTDLEVNTRFTSELLSHQQLNISKINFL